MENFKAYLGLHDLTLIYNSETVSSSISKVISVSLVFFILKHNLLLAFNFASLMIFVA